MKEPAQCQECGAPITSRHKILSGPNMTRFCSKTCANRVTARNRLSTKGWLKTPKGYILIRAPKHPMAGKDGYVMEHRLVMSTALGRALTPGEVVHHINRVRDDNRLENLELLDKRVHDSLPKPHSWRTTGCPHCGEPIQSRSRVRTVPADFAAE